MNKKELQEEIIRLKKEKDICILAHAYQDHELWEVADYMGDSFGLSLQAKEAQQKNVIMCGVRFMAETVKTLAPEKRVFLANANAGCPMARQMNREDVLKLKEQYPGYTVCAYINTTADLKRAVDVIVTSSSAVKIIEKLPDEKILFVPDRNLGGWIAAQMPDKTFAFFDGGCPSHMQITAEDVAKAREDHPQAEILVHPECLAEVTQLADYAGSTTGIMKYAKESDRTEFVIGTENSIVQHLSIECPEKRFYPLSEKCVCDNMRITTLEDLYNCIVGTSAEEILLSPQEIEESRKPIDRMIELGG
ncbi:MAG: quinolinate synthase NadA [Firmicutes bacterium]|nr:quinolinate synthase NadA [Bacillota bacterium]